MNTDAPFSAIRDAAILGPTSLKLRPGARTLPSVGACEHLNGAQHAGPRPQGPRWIRARFIEHPIIADARAPFIHVGARHAVPYWPANPEQRRRWTVSERRAKARRILAAITAQHGT
jgi:hypothetical protein